MIAVTVAVGEKYGLMAGLAAESCRRRTGLEVRILGDDAMRRQQVAKPHYLKFRLFEECPDAENILYFDADTVFLRDFEPRAFVDKSDFVCVQDRGNMDTVSKDAKRIGISADEYFNSGFFIANRTHHHAMLKMAEDLTSSIVSGLFDQTHLNAARIRMNIPALFLGREYNWLRFESLERPTQVVIGHIFKFGNRPDETIRRYYQFWARQRGCASPALQAARTRLAGRVFEYDRVGHDVRRMEFKPDGSIGAGAAGCEKRWEVTEEEGEIVLWIAGDFQPTCALTENAEGFGAEGGCVLSRCRSGFLPLLIAPPFWMHPRPWRLCCQTGGGRKTSG